MGLVGMGLSGCAGERPAERKFSSAVARSAEGNDEERKVVMLLRAGDAQQALRLSDQMMELDSPAQRKAGAYWKAVSLVYLGHLDSAVAWLKFRRGQWGGGQREALAEVLLFTLETKPHPCRESALAAGDKAALGRFEAMEKRVTELQGEVDGLQREKVRYEKLLHELDHLP